MMMKTAGFPQQADLHRTEIEFQTLGGSYRICLKSENVFPFVCESVHVFGLIEAISNDFKVFRSVYYKTSIQVKLSLL